MRTSPNWPLKAVSIALAALLTAATAVPASAGTEQSNGSPVSPYEKRYPHRLLDHRGNPMNEYYQRNRSRDLHPNDPRRRYHDGRRFEQGRRHDRDRRWRRHRDNDRTGAAILGGILGLGAGLAIGNANRAPAAYAPWSPEWYRYCDNKYRSFNPRTGYFLGYDGEYHFCRVR